MNNEHRQEEERRKNPVDQEEKKIRLEMLKVDLWKKRIDVVKSIFRILPTPKEAPLLWIGLIGTLGGGSIKAGLHLAGIDNPAFFNVNSVPRVEAPLTPAPTPSTHDHNEHVEASVEGTVEARRDAWRERQSARRTATIVASVMRTGNIAEAMSPPESVGGPEQTYIVMDESLAEDPEGLEIVVHAGQVVLIPHKKGVTRPAKVAMAQEPEGYRIQYTKNQMSWWKRSHNGWKVFWVFIGFGCTAEVWWNRRRKRKRNKKEEEAV